MQHIAGTETDVKIFFLIAVVVITSDFVEQINQTDKRIYSFEDLFKTRLSV